MSERQTVAGAYAKIDGHEELCAERYKGIEWKLHIIMGGLATIFVGLLSWMAIQLYTLEPLRVAAAHAQVAPNAQTVVVSPQAAPPAAPTGVR